MKKLLKDYEFNSDQQYFDMIVESVINGNRTQAKEQFKAMPRKEQKCFIVAIYDGWNCGLSYTDKAMFMTIL